MPDYFYIDLEARSELNIGQVGSYAYARHPSTEVLCIAHALNDQLVTVTPRALLEVDFAIPRGATIVAHNRDFESNVLAQKLGVDVDSYEWLDTAAVAARMSLPRNLEELGEFFFPEQPERWKDMEGRKIMLKLARPRRPSKDNPDVWWTEERRPEDFAVLYKYCAQDVELMRDVHRRLLELTPDEVAVWKLTERMNRRGVKIDLASIPVAQKQLAGYSQGLASEFRRIVGHPVKSYANVAVALGLEDVRKPTVRKALRSPGLPSEHRQALEIFQTLARSSTAKLDAMARRVCADGRLRGALNYCGAERTGRWSSMGVQLQNFPRGLGKETDLAFQALHADVLDEVFHGMKRPAPAKPLELVGAVAEMLRGFLVGPFIVGDLAQIEARMLAWLAGQQDLVEMFRAKVDPYCAMAAKIYGKPVSKKDEAERFMGKQVVLGAGYGLGHRGFRSLLDETYDVQIDEAFAKRVVKTYRSSNPKICAFWERLEKGLKYAILNKSTRIVVTPNIHMGVVTVAGTLYAFIELPSGRRLYYAEPEVKGGELRYYGRDIRLGGAWHRIPTYGGKIAENVTQAASRDVLAFGMLALEEVGFPLLITVHDEAVSEPRPGRDTGAALAEDVKLFHDVMVKVPSWANGLPVEAEVFSSARYRK